MKSLGPRLELYQAKICGKKLLFNHNKSAKQHRHGY